MEHIGVRSSETCIDTLPKQGDMLGHGAAAAADDAGALIDPGADMGGIGRGIEIVAVGDGLLLGIDGFEGVGVAARGLPRALRSGRARVTASGEQQLARKAKTGWSATASAASAMVAPPFNCPWPFSSSDQPMQIGLPCIAAPRAAARVSSIVIRVSTMKKSTWGARIAACSA